MSKEVKISHTNFFDFSKAETKEADDFISKVAKKIANRIDKKGLKELLDKASVYDSLSNELGCPLEVLFKALENGIYTIDKTWYSLVNLYFSDRNLYCQAKFKNSIVVHIKDYKKSWWLKEDKTE